MSTVTRLAQRARSAPLWAHAVALSIVLLALLPFVKTDAPFYADEGSALAQAQQLADGDGWTRPVSFPAADPDTISFGIFNAETVHGRLAPLGAHPLYALMATPFYFVGGVTGVIVLSLAGTVVAAVFGALIARRFRPSLAAPALWAIGLGTPLVVDGYLAAGHTIVAAIAAIVALCALRVIDDERRALMIAAAAVLTLVGGLIRNEFILFGAAIGVAAVVLGIAWRNRAALVLGVVVGVAGAAAREIEPHLRTALIPGGVGGEFSINTEAGSWLGHHVEGALITLIAPTYTHFGIPAFCLVLGVVFAFVAASIARRRPEDRSGIMLFGTVALVLLVARIFILAGTVPGLVWACPLLGLAVIVFEPELLRRRPVAFLVLGTGLYGVAVLLTQYAGGGGGQEWGWRYFSLALPVIAPVAVLAIADASARLGARDRRIAGGLLVGVITAVSIVGIVTLRDQHDENRNLVDTIRATYVATPARDGGKPVVLTTQRGTIDRFNWDHINETRWLTIDPNLDRQLDLFLDRTRDLGVGQVTFVTTDIDRDRPIVERHGRVIAQRSIPDGPDVLVVDLGSAAGP